MHLAAGVPLMEQARGVRARGEWPRMAPPSLSHVSMPHGRNYGYSGMGAIVCEGGQHLHGSARMARKKT